MRSVTWVMLLIAGLSASSAANAACTGSGLTWNCTAGSSAAEINQAISSASDNAVIKLAAGSYSATGILLNARNGLTIICASLQGCTMTGSQVFSASHNSTKTNPTRISGFVFSNANGGPTISLGYVGGDPGYEKMRIDHNRFKQTDGISIATGHTQSTRAVLGVIDHNTFEGSTHYYPLMIFGGGDNDWGGSHQGTVNNLFIEDNTFNFANENLSGGSGMDVWHGGRVVVRYNQITNARVAVHGTCHGGPANFEVYNNTIIGGAGSNGGYRLVHHQGSGEFMVFNNKLGPTTGSMSLLHYRSSDPNPEGCGVCNGSSAGDGNRSPTTTYYGYPCRRQPGRTGTGQLRPVYLWNNRYESGGGIVRMNLDSAGGTNRLSYHVKHNRDLFEATSNLAQSSPSTPFNGSTGMGFGTLANRPTTCDTGSEPAGGVGYFATNVGPQGTLYRCSATNTWTAHYVPYAYPHPLQDESPIPNPPEDLTVQ